MLGVSEGDYGEPSIPEENWDPEKDLHDFSLVRRPSKLSTAGSSSSKFHPENKISADGL